MTENKPTILIIDDILSQAEGLATELRDEPVRAIATTPDEIELGLLDSAQLIVVDHRLDEWPQRDTVENPASDL